MWIYIVFVILRSRVILRHVRGLSRFAVTGGVPVIEIRDGIPASA